MSAYVFPHRDLGDGLVVVAANPEAAETLVDANGAGPLTPHDWSGVVVYAVPDGALPQFWTFPDGGTSWPGGGASHPR